jgi:hypothetical protein
MINDNFKITGRLIIEKNGEVVQEVDNLVVTAGKNWVIDRMADANTVMTHMELGTGTTAAAVGDTTLGAIISSSRTALTTSGGTTSGTSITYACTFASGTGTGAVTEAGIFDATTGGDMLARTVFDVVNKGASDSMTITWTVTIS